MSDDGLSGIRSGGGDEDSEPEEYNAESLLNDLQVSNLSELDDDELAVIRSIIGGDVTLEGIGQEVEGDERAARMVRERAIATSKAERDDIFQDQLEELEDIDNEIGLLRNLAASVKTTNNLLADANTLLADIVASNARGPALTIKDSSQITFDRSNNVRDVTLDTDISTSIILVKAPASNNGDLFIGEDSLSVDDGFRLEAGEKQSFQVDLLIDRFLIVAENASDSYTYVALGRDE